MASRLSNVFIAVVRVDGQVIVASYGQPEYEGARHCLGACLPSESSTGCACESMTSPEVSRQLHRGCSGAAVLAVTNASYPERIVFTGFIEDAMGRFLSKGYMWSSASAGQFSRKFKGDLAALCKEYDDQKSKDKIARLRAQVAVVQGTMQDNIAKALDNLESTERLEEQSKDLLDSAHTFQRSAKKLAWKEWCMLMKMRFLIVFVVLVIIGVIIGVACQNGCGGGEPAPASGSGTVSTTPASS